jgi:hypothetical protein
LGKVATVVGWAGDARRHEDNERRAAPPDLFLGRVGLDRARCIKI